MKITLIVSENYFTEQEYHIQFLKKIVKMFIEVKKMVRFIRVEVNQKYNNQE